ncbi:MAG: pseudouridine-5'-phosphate glycosidase [Pyrinomonadaceae bacterium]|nr:pseudouridine-5'-phosphate glycosidase [Pyrinomonadaceae bacterium]
MEIRYGQEVSDALDRGKPLVALESTVIAHGLPFPQNVEMAFDLESIVRKNGATPATIAVFDGEFCVGLSKTQIKKLAADKNIRKISKRDLPIAAALKLDCATTVATTMFIAQNAGIRVFSTGGIGGVHRGDRLDISADLNELANTPMITVCSGAKIVLDLPATREWLETNGVTILGYKSDEFPAFYSSKSGLYVDERVESIEQVVEISRARDDLGLKNAILLVVPIPHEFEIEIGILEDILSTTLEMASQQEIAGKHLTPFLLSKMSEISKGVTMDANIALLKNNAEIAAKAAVHLKKY